MDTEPKPKENYIAEYIIGIGYLLFFCLAIALCSIFYYLTYLQPQPPAINTFATSLPPTTPTPHVLPTNQENAKVIFKDDFSDNSHGWAGTEDSSKEQVTLGKLLFESRSQNSYAFTGCGSCPSLDRPFYLQADFSTGKVTDRGFGIYFNYDSSSDNGSFFLFRINPEARKYYFYHGSNDGWSLRAAGEIDQIKSFPAVNTLGIYAKRDLVEFYVNGKIVDSYQETAYSFHDGNFGFYIDGSDFQLVVDNLLIRDIGE